MTMHATDLRNLTTDSTDAGTVAFGDLLSKLQASGPRVCPLCGTLALEVRGIRRPGFFEAAGATAAIRVPPPQVEWRCRRCGFVASFTAERFRPESLPVVEPPPPEAPPRTRRPPDEIREQGSLSKLVATFAVSFAAWLLLTWSLNTQDLVLGVAISALVASLTYRLAGLSLSPWLVSPRRWVALARLTLMVLFQLFFQNLTLAYRVFHPRLPIRPGIVAFPTRLRSEMALTILSNAICLTPDTVTLDIDSERGLVYVHWIDVQTEDPHEARELLAAGIEAQIARWLV